ncbi:hypothetical protein [Roseivirga pacifica]|uniref:hypothetical protein n=1 Tax=Roseivirga pacifica TaxID=1267423 RepID=UPI002094B488|nr:hypothetical protein [Roseivirga pacifica]MCO6360894.1 hypothetical protein [Roseivirga pacifica]MCO6368783.1 hypothetical protein [Roseivirga pacifica]MCO6372927.1 hypothetical protein [Roseivirga pacifica]MCO6376987.1 hypothetical protein [Roseivirga pacifica]MCO6377736.1 hypothetical protein [Roseivirga pacifica]
MHQNTKPQTLVSRLFTFSLVILFAYSCSSTSLINSWKDPDFTDNPRNWDKVLVAVQSSSEGQRRVAEDKLASMSDKLYPSYNIFASKTAIADEDVLRRKISDGEYDAIMTMRLLNKEQQDSYVPGSYTGGYWAFHGPYWGAYYDPGYYRSDTYYSIETQVFSIKENKLVWSGISSTVNPTKVDKTIEEIARSVYRQMVKDGFIEGK